MEDWELGNGLTLNCKLVGAFIWLCLAGSSSLSSNQIKEDATMASCSIGGYEVIIPRRAIDQCSERVVLPPIIQSQRSVNTNSSSKHPSLFASISRKDGSIQDKTGHFTSHQPPLPMCKLNSATLPSRKRVFWPHYRTITARNINYVTDNKEVVIASIGVTIDPSTC